MQTYLSLHNVKWHCGIHTNCSCHISGRIKWREASCVLERNLNKYGAVTATKDRYIPANIPHIKLTVCGGGFIEVRQNASCFQNNKYGPNIREKEVEGWRTPEGQGTGCKSPPVQDLTTSVTAL